MRKDRQSGGRVNGRDGSNSRFSNAAKASKNYWENLPYHKYAGMVSSVRDLKTKLPTMQTDIHATKYHSFAETSQLLVLATTMALSATLKLRADYQLPLRTQYNSNMNSLPL
jgi:hypothetical protein